jgi:hypothetical protein
MSSLAMAPICAAPVSEKVRDSLRLMLGKVSARVETVVLQKQAIRRP